MTILSYCLYSGKRLQFRHFPPFVVRWTFSPEGQKMPETQKRFTRKIQELTALYEISHAMASALDFKSASNQILEVLSHQLDMNRGTITILDKETGQLSIEAAHGL